MHCLQSPVNNSISESFTIWHFVNEKSEIATTYRQLVVLQQQTFLNTSIPTVHSDLYYCQVKSFVWNCRVIINAFIREAKIYKEWL